MTLRISQATDLELRAGDGLASRRRREATPHVNGQWDLPSGGQQNCP